MKTGLLCIVAGGGLALALAWPSDACGDDWPAWRGPNRDGICRETGLLKRWPAGGPKLLWKTTGLGEGYSGPAIVGNLLYTMGNIDGQERVLALDVSQQGKQVWQAPIGAVRPGIQYPGPRSTPTIDGDRLYTLGVQGDLVSMNTADGHLLWRHDLVKDFGGTRPNWGYAESVLVDGPWVLCTPGGAKNTIAALDKETGKRVWGSPAGDPAEYSSIIKPTLAGVKQYVTLTKKGVIGVAAEDGKFLWRWEHPHNNIANITTCVWHDDTIFAASAYNTGGGLVDIKQSGDGFEAKERYFVKKMQNHHGGLILHDGMLYGCGNPKVLMCLDYETGDIKWSNTSSGKCSLLFADGMLYCRSEDGPISLVEATPAGFQLKGRFNQPDRSAQKSWPHLVIANGVLYVRDQDVLLAYDVRAAQ
jgi:outer membrane protein assembly factor BamB